MDLVQLRRHMEVVGADGVSIGRVESIDGDRIRLSGDNRSEDVHLFLRLDDIAYTDDQVHLRQSSEELVGGKPRGAAAAAPPPATEPAPGAAREGRHDGVLPPIANPAVKDARPRANYYLPWVIAGLVLLGLLWVLVSGDRDREAAPAVESVRSQPALFGNEIVTLPGGERLALKSGTLNFDVHRYLASADPSPRNFAFDRLNFATGSAAVRAEHRDDLHALAQLLAAYPNARVEIVGYADARGSQPFNARLGEQRAMAVAGALMAEGVDAQRLSAVSGGENAPIGSNASAQGRAENRRTELIVTK